MTAKFQTIKDAEFEGVTIYVLDELHTITGKHPMYAQILDHLNNGVDDDKKLVGMINPAVVASKNLMSLTERIKYVGGTILLDGDPLDNALASHIVRIIEGGGNKDDYESYAKMLEKLVTNPSKVSQQHLYAYIENHGITILPDGDLLLYKGVLKNGTSSHAGYGIVNDVVYDKAHLPNPIGAVVEIPREMVDENRQTSCSVGLHVGAYSYASTFADKLLTVKVNPRDVVSVPHDYKSAKIRVSRYTVLENAAKEITTPTYTPKVKKAKKKVTKPVVDDESVLSDEEIRTNEKIAKFTALIPEIQKSGKSLRFWRNKKITAKNRPLFDKVVSDLGLSY